ncbi:phosphoribosylglycinamide formyltransferase 1 [Sterolibacterium denitrificans]|uniref:Phosphoribosylglycinamide formyltransferase n=1 Tax=Sterolibacterium denitrificans TaxID=157592 RepID=A0A7Z7MUV4_9PROT|nr:phosphoribosylglycinamide formyltransferase [Sterolibacterium denitrificans]SMB24770.1 phosphoribosylglycinamide formyltransferase 1 [Sterolibacterium denitrificans]
MKSRSIVILISGRGSNMRSLVEANLPDCRIAVISNRPDAAGLAYARERGLATAVVDHRAHATRPAFDAALAEAIDAHGADLVVLAGFMRILGVDFVARYQGRLLNIHPSLLPAFPGTHTHAQALAAGVRIHGCTVHFVTPALDSGPIVIQAAVPVLPDDDPDTLAARVLAQEHVIYPQAVRWFLAGQLQLTAAGQVRLSAGAGRAATAALIAPQTDAA